MKITCTLQLEFKSKTATEKILRSLKVDDLDFINSQQKDNTIQAEIKDTNLSSVLHTLDDYLACVTVAEKIVNKN